MIKVKKIEWDETPICATGSIEGIKLFYCIKSRFGPGVELLNFLPGQLNFECRTLGEAQIIAEKLLNRFVKAVTEDKQQKPNIY